MPHSTPPPDRRGRPRLVRGASGVADATPDASPAASPGPAAVTGVGAADYEESWADLTARVWDLSTPHVPFFLLVTLSTTIASYGLLSNSTAVVIGAMLVAPLMGPIFGIALGLASGDARLLARASTAELQGMALSVALGFVIGLVPHHPAFGSEILARTRPTVYDVIVAVASGLAGAFALADKRVSPALPGVAIATAIVPPLATVGLCLSSGRLDLAGGAFLLFFANLLAIEAVAAAYFTWVGVRRGDLHETTVAGFLRHFGVSVLLLVGVGLFLTRTLLAGIAAERREQLVRRALGDELRIAQGARLAELTLEDAGLVGAGAAPDTLRAFAVVMTPQEVAAEQVAQMERALVRVVDRPVRLVVRSLIARDADRAGPVYVAPEELAERARAADAEAQTRMLARASDVLRGRFATMPGVELEELRRVRREVAPAPPDDSAAGASLVAGAGAAADRPTGGGAPTADGPDAARPAAALAPPDTVDVFTAVVRTPAPFTPAQVDSLDRVLDAALGTPVRLVVRSVLVQDVDAAGFLHERAAASAADSAPPRRGRPR